MATFRSSLESLAKRLTTQLQGTESAEPETTALPKLQQSPRDPMRGGTNLAALFEVLDGEIMRAQRYRRDLAIAVFDIPLAFARDRQLALRNSVNSNVRGADIPIWVSSNTLTLVLPETGVGAHAATERITRVLSDVSGGPVASGYARFPEDGQTASELLRRAVRQKRATPICAVGGASCRREIPVGDPQGALPEPGHENGGVASRTRREADRSQGFPLDSDVMALARAEFLRAALRLAELEALARDPNAGDAETQACLRELGDSLADLDLTIMESSSCSDAGPASTEREDLLVVAAP